MEQRRWALFAALIMGGVGVRLQAQARAPKVYSITERNSMMMANMTIRAVRDGSKEVIDKTYPPIAANPKGYHSRTFYDFKAHKSYLVDLKVPGPCGAVTYTSSHAPWFDDPFAGGADNPLHSLPPKARHVGVAKIAGLTADELQAPDPDQPGATVRIWIARQPRLVVKMQSVAPHGIARTLMAVGRISFAKPAASLFVPPANCQAWKGTTNAHGGSASRSVSVGGKAKPRAPIRKP